MKMTPKNPEKNQRDINTNGQRWEEGQSLMNYPYAYIDESPFVRSFGPLIYFFFKIHNAFVVDIATKLICRTSALKS